MTVNDIISLIRFHIKEHNNNTYYEDQELWKLFTVCKSELIKQRGDKFKYISPQNRVTFCLELEKAKSHECGCITAGCDVLKTKNKIPKYIVNRNNSSLKLYTLDWSEIYEVAEKDLFVNQQDDILKSIESFSIVNNKIIVWNNKDLKVIQVQAIWEDITEINNVQYCNSTLSDNSCFDPFSFDIDIDIDMVYAAMLKMFRLLNLPLSLVEDMVNDGKTTK